MSRRVVILGGGVIGLCCAYYAARHGWRVTVIERDGPERDGCSFGNAGMIVPSHFTPFAAPGMAALGLKWMLRPDSPFYIKPRWSFDLLRWCWLFCRSATPLHVRRCASVLRDLHLASRTEFENLAKTLDDDFGLTCHGILMLCKTPAAFHEEAHAAARAHRLGMAAQVLDARQVAELEPELHLGVFGGVLYPGDATLHPGRFMASLQRELEKCGVAFLWNVTAHAWAKRRQSIVAIDTNRGSISGDAFVVAAGSWSNSWTRDLGFDLPLQPGKGYSVTLPAPVRLPRRGIICVEARLAITPMGSALRVGGTMELAGLDTNINPTRVAGIARSFPSYFADFREEELRAMAPWCGLRPCSPDGMPYLGRTTRWDNLIIATGHAMMGVSLGPITGRIVANLLDGGAPPVDLALLRPERFR